MIIFPILSQTGRPRRPPVASPVPMLPLTRLLRLSVLPLAALTASAAPTPPAAVFAPGDRWAAIGDSITHAGAYQSYLNLFFLTRYPGQPLAVANCGVSGDTAPGALGRYDWDIAPFHPTVATVMLGMNDLGRPMFMPSGPVDDTIKAQNLANYHRDLAALLDRLGRDGVRVILLTPTAYDDTAKNDQMPPVLGINAELRAGSDIGRELARARGLAFVDFFDPMLAFTLARQKEDPAFSLTSSERVHPLLPGHFLMAVEFLRQLNCRPQVATIAVATGDAASAAPAHCRITNLARTPQGLTFDCLEEALPFPVPDDVAAIAARLDFTEKWNREMLVVPGLAAGDYALAIDGVEIARLSAAQLAAGVNLAGYPAAPQAVQARQVGVLERQRFDLEVRLRILAQWHQFRELNGVSPDNTPEADAKFDAKIAEWQAAKRPYADIFAKLNLEFKDTRAHAPELARQRDDLARQARESAQPRVHRFTVSAVASR